MKSMSCWLQAQQYPLQTETQWASQRYQGLLTSLIKTPVADIQRWFDRHQQTQTAKVRRTDPPTFSDTSRAAEPRAAVTSGIDLRWC